MYIGWLFGERGEPGAPTMPGLAAIACVEAKRIEGERVTRATRYYLSFARLTPERFAQAVRAYWAIENSLHWVLDASFDEDRARNGRKNLAILRRLALNPLSRTTQARHQPQTQTRRMVRRLRQIHHRPNAMALAV